MAGEIEVNLLELEPIPLLELKSDGVKPVDLSRMITLMSAE
jgi:hypothetical protein